MDSLRLTIALAVLLPRAAAQETPLIEHTYAGSGLVTVAGLGDLNGDGVQEYGLALPTAARVVVRSVLGGAVHYELNGYHGAGRTLAGLGDVDGDGLDDWALSGSGPVTVYRGYDGVQLHSFLAPNSPSAVVARAGDVDADGFADVLIGFENEISGGVYLGAAYVYSGRTGTLIHKLLGTFPQGKFGHALAGVGDVTGDGRADFAVGASREDSPTGVPGAGVVRLFSGADASVVHTWSVDNPYSEFGTSVAGLGDVDGDGRGDVAAAGPWYDGAESNIGVVQVFSGASGALLHTFEGKKKTQKLQLVTALGDFDGDGFDDLAFAGEPVGYQKVKVASGRTGAVLRTFSGPPQYGSAISGIGDVDGDGLAELLVGLPASGVGKAYVYLGFGAPVGDGYCQPAVGNSTGWPAQLFTSGSDVLGDQNLRVSVQRVPPGRFGLLLASQLTGFVAGAGGSQGNLCLKQPVARFTKEAAAASAAGTFGWDVDLTKIPGHGAVMVGQTWNFQVWYRDENPGATSNYTDASSVLFL